MGLNGFMPNMNQGNNFGGGYQYGVPYSNQMAQLNNYMEQLKNPNGMNMQQAQPMPQQQSTNMNFIVVEGQDYAEKYIVQNGQTLWFRHSMKPEIYVKSV